MTALNEIKRRNNWFYLIKNRLLRMFSIYGIEFAIILPKPTIILKYIK